MEDYVRSNAPGGISFQRVYAKPTTRDDDDDDSGEHLTLQLSSTNRLKNERQRKKTGCATHSSWSAPFSASRLVSSIVSFS